MKEVKSTFVLNAYSTLDFSFAWLAFQASNPASAESHGPRYSFSGVGTLRGMNPIERFDV